jgi:hypothetical protein
MSEATHDELLAAAKAAQKIAPGAWEHDTEKSEGAYGSGPDAVHGFAAYFMMDGQGRRLFDSHGSEVAEIHEEDDEDGTHAWDETSRQLFNFCAAFHPARAISLLEQTEGLQRELEAALDLAKGYHEERDQAEAQRDGLRAAINWLDEPFIDKNTTAAELRSRIGFMMADRDRALSAPVEPQRGDRVSAGDAYGLVCKVGRLSHTQDDDYIWPDDPADTIATLDGLIADARDIMALSASPSAPASPLPAMAQWKANDIVRTTYGIRAEIVRAVEGWWEIRFIDGSTAVVRPSSLSPFADRAAWEDEPAEAGEDLGCDYCRDGDKFPAGADYWKCPQCDGEWWPKDDAPPATPVEGE